MKCLYCDVKFVDSDGGWMAWERHIISKHEDNLPDIKAVFETVERVDSAFEDLSEQEKAIDRQHEEEYWANKYD